MVSPMLALGVVTGVVERELVGVTPEQRFEELAALPPDAVLRFVSPGCEASKLGTFAGVADKNGQPCIRIEGRAGRGNITYYEPAHWALNIQRTNLRPEDIPKSGRGRRGRGSSHHFWASFLPESDFEAFNRDAKIECLLFGTGMHLREEIREQKFRVSRETDKFAVASLDDVLRVRAYSNPVDPCWTQVGTTGGSRRLSERLKLKPRAVIFDGSRGFLRWRKYFGDSAWILVLDRNDPQFSEGVSELNEHLASCVESDILCLTDELPPGVEIPPGVETTAFFQKRVG